MSDAHGGLKRYHGGCHCGAVRFTVRANPVIEAQRCNCSICAMTGFVHMIVPKQQFDLIKGCEQLTTYTFNTGVAQHYFCNICGVKSFYVPRSNPQGISINVNCLDLDADQSILLSDFDGQNWEKHAGELSHLA